MSALTAPGSGTLLPVEAAPTPDPQFSSPWVAFSYLSIWGYLLYGLGSATPYLRSDLGLTAFEGGLHGSALAVGSLVAGFTAAAIAGRMGMGRLLDAAVAMIVIGVGLLVVAPVFPVSLFGAFLIGLGGGSMGTHLNLYLTRGGGPESRKLMNQANAWSMLTAGAAPVAVGLSASVLGFWRLSLLAAMAAILALTLARPRSGGAAASVRMPKSSLPRRYWLAWMLLFLGVSIEFSFVFWGSTMVARRTGLSSADATLLASLFVAGMFTGRAALGRGMGANLPTRTLLTGGLVIVLVGASLVWVAALPALAGVGLFLGGLGTASLWPIGIILALQSAPKAQLEASARATLAAGAAVLVAPSALGLLADAVGVATAWPVILLVALACMVVVAVTPKTA